MKLFKKPLFVYISPNAEWDDVWLAFKLLFQPWKWVHGNNPEKFSEELKKYLGVKHAFAFDSGRTSLYAILQSCNLKEGDDVLVQAFNCTAAVNPILWVGANPVYVDIESDGYNMSPEDLEKKITPKSKVLIIQHTFGFPAKFDELLAIAKKYNLKVIEDVAHSLGAEFNGKKLGTFGDAAFFSFGRFKIISAVFAGAAVTNDKEIAENLKKFYDSSAYPLRYWIFQQLFHPVLLAKAKPLYNFLSIGKILVVIAKKLNLISLTVYSEEKSGGHPGFGPSKMPNALAILGLNQIKKIDSFNAHRVRLSRIYEKVLTSINGSALDFTETIPGGKSVYLYFPIRFKNIHMAYDLIGLGRKEEGIYLENWPARKVIGPAGTDLEKLRYKIRSCPEAEDAALKTVCLPTGPNIKEKDAERVANFVRKFCELNSSSDESDGDGVVIREIDNKEEWEKFLEETEPKTFLQSWAWGEFDKSMGKKVWRLGIYGPNLVGVALVEKISARRGKFLYIPHGPVMKNYQLPITNYRLQILVSYLKKIADVERCSFIRISPLMLKNPENEELFKELGFRGAPIHMHAAELVWMLDLSQSEEQLQKGMRKTTRYLIRKAGDEPIDIVRSDKIEDLEKFSKVYKETVKRQHFTPYSRKFLEKEFQAFSPEKQVLFFFAEYNHETIGAAMIIFSGDSAFYHQGASSGKYPKLQAPYLLQWEIIKEAKDRGYKYYNFWGISPAFAKASAGKPDNKFRKHPWDGLSLFKTGFGGFSEEYVSAQDLVLKKSYWIAYIIEKVRKIKRGL